MNGKTMQNRIFYLFCLILSGCAAIVPAPPATTPDMKVEKRELASLHLTEQGRMLLESGKVDDAISVLERAVSVYASNGKNTITLRRPGSRKAMYYRPESGIGWRRCIWRLIANGHSGFTGNAR